ncbi:hypothetical protein BO71DRAFT_398934 [Aspergillus ellipticus CBS 707.79]|uniref:Uncharacterized protein n=1 Tax=Aspergillus ellipticus CBS 707.79 TaxID=1448320 RepID=A0A319DAA0_9EURO|nr:hypothetical protein BO71DRAFT_398934 [Aspergillus ellipticus CBS 707.79]
MDDFSTMPNELGSNVDGYATDWVGLESLFRASPQVGEPDPKAEADLQAIRLVESILQKDPIMSHELHLQFRMALNLRQSSLADANLAEFMAHDHSLSLLASSSITQALLREMVTVAANIQLLACACLATFSSRLRAVQPRRWEGSSGPRMFIVEGTGPYEPRDAGSPSWIEEYRVYRAIWHLQLHADLLVAGDKLNWPESDLEHLRTNHIDWNHLPDVAGEELRAVSECLESLRGPTIQPSSSSSSSNSHLISQIPDVSQLRHRFDVWVPPAQPKPSCNHDDVAYIWGQGLEMTGRNRAANAWEACQFRTSHSRWAKFQVCSLQDSRPYRALGMPIWDLWRLYGLGLWNALYPIGPNRATVPTPDGSEVPMGSCPPSCGGEIDYRFSVYIDARLKMEGQERDAWVEGK